jgi:hypothetical protein
VTLDPMLTALTGAGECAIDPFDALLVAAHASLRDAVEQREGRIFEFIRRPGAQVLDQRRMMAGSRE